MNQRQIPKEHHGFLPGRSIQSNLPSCLLQWTSEVERGNTLDAIYLDFCKAFDRVPKRRLLHKLGHVGVSGLLLKWLEAYLSDSTFRVKVGDSLSRSAEVLSGVPQGFVVGPLLFIVYTADLGNIITSPFAMYPDDIKLYKKSSNSLLLQEDLFRIGNWSGDWLLPLNNDKCNVLHIGNNNPKYRYNLDGKQLTQLSCCRDLGIITDSGLTCSHHVACIVKKAHSLLSLLRKTFCKISPLVLPKLYKTHVRPILEFCNFGWGLVLQRDINQLESVQPRATRIPFGRIRPQYHERLSQMQLTTLSERDIRGDLITTYQAVNNPSSPICHL
ncbi:hypothetical protein Zmor_018337 [Zophobas morio]|uniref:Reverse transcriptase domain-containing protein n=1 Tax=Zophobas morio TaxID=2755281 RepID=A0AA38IE15_9CUCU|nr:hypothetical protein Zmor_018337 [Zophobas morio]